MRIYVKRVMMAFLGILICGISVGFFKQALFGTDPFMSFANGLANLIPIQFGTLYMLMNLAMLAVIFFLDRHYIGLSTFLNIFGIGYLTDATVYLLQMWFPNLTLAGRILFLLIGIVLVCFSSSLYYTADLGVSTYDAIALILADKKIARFQFCRIGTDLICVLLGFIMGAVIGIGTLITAFFMGPLIHFFNLHLSVPFLWGKGNIVPPKRSNRIRQVQKRSAASTK